MMKLYGATHHLMVLTDAIDAIEHAHSFIQLVISLDSAFEIEIEGQNMLMEGVVIQSHVAHQLRAKGQPLLMLLMDKTSDLAASFKHVIGDNTYGIISANIAKEGAAFARSHLEKVKKESEYWTFLHDLLGCMHVEYKPPAVADERIKKLIQLMKECTDSEHSVGFYAEQFGLSASRLSHLFKQNTGISFSGYMLLHKLQKACYLIFNGASITEASLAAGFDSPSHFANTSKKLLGMTAKDIRKDSVFLQVSNLQSL